MTPTVLVLWLATYLAAGLPCSLVPAAATDLVSRRVAVCRRAASLASITTWSSRCWSMMLNSASGSCTTTIEPHDPFHLAAKLECLYSRCCRLYQNHAVCCRPPGFTTSVTPLSARYIRRARSHPSSAHGRSGGKPSHHLSAAHQRQQKIRSLSLAPARRDRSRACYLRIRLQPSFA